MTQGAILDAFVRLLLEKNYERLTIREIALVAGVGLGTVYEYFPSKKSIAAHCIHQRFKAVGERMQLRLQAEQDRALPDVVASMLDEILNLHLVHVQEWSALIFLERKISDFAAYQNMYAGFVEIWEQVFNASCDRTSYANKSPALVHAALYGVLYQRLMTAPESVADVQFRQDLHDLLKSYLSA